MVEECDFKGIDGLCKGYALFTLKCHTCWLKGWAHIEGKMGALIVIILQPSM